MAFLCPVRIRRNKKKKDNGEDHSIPQLGRITGSSSIETLVRVGLEKEAGISPDSRMLVLHDFTPCVDDELEVKKGDLVSLLYRENDWAYVIDERSPLGQQNEGFIPYSYITPFLQDNNKHLSRSKKPPREETNSTASSNAASMISAASASSEIHPFYKDPSLGRFIVLYSFTARDENDINVHRGEFITVLNKDDPDWFWIIRDYDGQEGFVPAAFIYPLIVSVPASSGSSSNGNSHQSHGHHRITNGHGHGHQQQQLPLPPPPTQTQTHNSNSHSTNSTSNNFNHVGVNNLISATSALHITSTNSAISGLPAPSSMSMAMSMSPPNYYNTKPKEPDSIRIQTSAITAIPAINSTHANSAHTNLNPNSNAHNNPPLPLPTSTSTSLPALMPPPGDPGQQPPGEKAGTELIMLYDYKAQVSDDLSVRRGDWVYADLTCQPVEGWLWAYAPKQRKYGFVPKAYARPPAMTSL